MRFVRSFVLWSAEKRASAAESRLNDTGKVTLDDLTDLRKSFEAPAQPNNDDLRERCRRAEARACRRRHSDHAGRFNSSIALSCFGIQWVSEINTASQESIHSSRSLDKLKMKQGLGNC